MTAATSGEKQLLQRIFDRPPREFSPTPIWWWSGGRLELERLCWQLEQLAAGGVYNVVILNLAPAGPVYGRDADDPPFMSEEWWRLFAAICARARALGTRIWFYDQIGFSGANIQGELCLRNERCRGMLLASDVVENAGRAEFPAQAMPLAAFVSQLDENGRAAGTPRELPIEGFAVRCETEGRCRLRLVYALHGGFDYFDPLSCQALLEAVHGEFERRVGTYFGDVIAGSFQDELPSMPTWGSGFGRAFEARAGYDLKPHLWALWEGETKEARRVRTDYQRVRGALAEEAFFRPFFDWHEKRGMLCGCDQQSTSRMGCPVDTVKQYADYPRTHRWYGAPGSDHHGEARIHSSLAEHYGRRRVWVEAFHSTGWGGTLEETFDWLLPWWLAGGNLYSPHAVYYSTKGGWWEWAPPSTCWRQPYWKHYAQFAGGVSRICALLAHGGHCCEVAILHPTTTIQAFLTLEAPLPPATTAEKIYGDLVGKMVWYDPRPGMLGGLRVDYNVLDDDTLQRGEACEGRLKVGHSAYSTLLLPGCVALEKATARKLARFVEAGGRLIAIGAKPESEDLDPYFESKKALCVSGAGEVAALLAETPCAVTAPVPVRHLRLGEANMAFVPMAYPGATRQNTNPGWWMEATYTFDAERYQRPMTVTIHQSSIAVEIWDPASGKRFTPRTTQATDGTRVEIPDDVSAGVFLVWTANPSGETEVAGMRVWTELARLPSRWTFELEQTMDNRHGDLTWPAHRGAPSVPTWSFRHREERESGSGAAGWNRGEWREGSYDIAHATFGTQGWLRGPVAPNDLQPPGRGGGWNPAVYSLSRGIWRDPQHIWTLGPGGHVPEYFLDFGLMREGQAAQFATWIWVDVAREAHLAIAAPGRRTAKINGVSHTETAGGNTWLQAVELQAGWNQIEWHFVAQKTCKAHCYWALVADPARFRRPEFLTSADEPQAGSSLVFTKEFEIPFDAEGGEVLVYATCPCRILLDGVEIGRQGGFMPYGHADVAVVKKLGPLARGNHRFELHGDDGRQAEWILDPETGSSDVNPSGALEPVWLLLDARWRGEGGRLWTVATSEDWLVQRVGGSPLPAGLRLGRPSHWMTTPYLLRPRPHPLPRAHWLEIEPAGDTVLDLQPDPLAGGPRTEWFQWLLPPGATRLRLSVEGCCSLWVDGEPVEVCHKAAVIPHPQQAGKTAVLRVKTDRGSSGGGLFLEPVTYEMGVGEIELGDWTKQGLESYSGGVKYRSAFHLAATESPRLAIDLGKVRGSAEVWINGRSAGVRVLSPFRFEMAGLACKGKNDVEVLVLNTLAPYLAGQSPTPFARSGQHASGLFGPVRILGSV